MHNTLSHIPKPLQNLNNPPKKIFYKGNIKLLDNFKIAIIGTRYPNQYTQIIMQNIIPKISKYATIISGGAIGVDSIAHKMSYPNTIMISPSSLDIIYPKQNKTLINNITNNALILSEYESNYKPHRFSFLERNRLVIALSEIVFIPQGDLNSGTSVSAKIALELKKPIFTIPHRYNESMLTNSLLSKNNAKAIYNIDDFVKTYLPNNALHSESLQTENKKFIDVLDFCANNPSLEDAYIEFGEKITECEILGLITIKNNKIYLEK